MQTSDLTSKIICTSCGRTPDFVLESPCCGLIYCWNCVEGKTTVCAVCKKELFPHQFQANQAIQNIIDRARHPSVSLCPQGCGEVVTASTVREHLNNCNNRTLACAFCGQLYRASQQQPHMQTCPRAVRQCEYAAYGCSAQIPAEEYVQHLQNFQSFHLEMLMRTVKNQAGEISNYHASAHIANPPATAPAPSAPVAPRASFLSSLPSLSSLYPSVPTAPSTTTTLRQRHNSITPVLDFNDNSDNNNAVIVANNNNNNRANAGEPGTQEIRPPSIGSHHHTAPVSQVIMNAEIFLRGFFSQISGAIDQYVRGQYAHGGFQNATIAMVLTRVNNVLQSLINDTHLPLTVKLAGFFLLLFLLKGPIFFIFRSIILIFTCFSAWRFLSSTSTFTSPDTRMIGLGLFAVYVIYLMTIIL